MNLYHTRIGTIGLCLLCALSRGTGAQLLEEETYSGPPWYQIEIIVFEHNMQSGDGKNPETWPRDLLLIYPPNSQYIYSAEDIDTLEKRFGNSSQSDNNPWQTLLARQYYGELPFVELGGDIEQLSRELRAIDAERDMRVLLHKVWRQPLVDRDHAPATLMFGGARYDQRYELQGTVTLSVSRYLHIETNLWFTRFEVNLGQDDSYWPKLPDLPEKFPTRDGSDLLSNQPNMEAGDISEPWRQNYHFNLQTPTSDNKLNFGQSPEEPQNQYAVVKIVKFEQSRRMRSGELHYLDHPRLGLLVRVDAYEKKKPGNNN